MWLSLIHSIEMSIGSSLYKLLDNMVSRLLSHLREVLLSKVSYK